MQPPSWPASLARGIVGFTLLSVAGFAPWAFAGGWFKQRVGEAGMYAACAIVFIALSGPALHGLMAGPRSTLRFYKIFGPAFAAYSAAWIGGWMAIRGHAGSLVGLFAGTLLMGLILAGAFGAWRAAPKCVTTLFVLNAAGYFVGGWVEAWIASGPHTTLSMLLWGVCYGFGLGAGVGLAFYFCQSAAYRGYSSTR